MARYKIIDRSPRFLPVILEAQLMSGGFEYALDYLIDQQLYHSAFLAPETSRFIAAPIQQRLERVFLQAQHKVKGRQKASLSNAI